MLGTIAAGVNRKPFVRSKNKAFSPCCTSAVRLCALALAAMFFFCASLSSAAEPLRFDPPPVDLDYNDPVTSDPGTSPPTPRSTPSEDASEQEPPASSTEAPGTSEAPAAISAPAGPKPVRLFGTVEFRSPINNIPKWERVRNSEAKNPTFGDRLAQTMPANVVPRWQALKAELEGKPLMEQAQGVNKFFNQWPYKTDRVVWGLEDYWATPAEFMKKSGDCEDYAISKYYALRDLGVPASKLRIIAVKDTVRNLGHAILGVIDNGNAYILDNLTNLVLSHTRLTNYAPQFSVNEEYLWRHVKPLSGPKK